jgi:broad specificity phosphatase PhoE
MSDKKLIAVVQRHGSTILNEDNKFRSRMDPPLDERGIKQAEAAAQNLRDEGLEVKRIVSSPMLRAVQTADAIAEEFGLDVEQDRALISWNLGFLSGKDKDAYGPILELYVDNPKLVPPDGESLDTLEDRNFHYFDKELRKENKLTVYVSHNSNCVAVNRMIDEEYKGRAESDDVSVKPGGTLGIYVDSKGNYSVEVLFGKKETAAFGS